MENICCGDCAVVRAEQDARTALAWAHEPGASGQWLCPDCARAHLRDIEAKLA
ncbi:MAG: hypothetical protein ACRDSP_25325 [Pseudonocardiaceae bacterium]